MSSCFLNPVIVVNYSVHQLFPHHPRDSTLKRLGQFICPHFFSRAVLNYYFSFLYLVSDKEIPSVDVLGPLGTREFPVDSKPDGLLIVLVD